MMRLRLLLSLPWLLPVLLLALAVLPSTDANAQSCSATLNFSDIGAEQQDNFSSCSTALQASSDHQDNTSPRWSGLQTSMGALVRGPFACGVGSATGCLTSQPTTQGDANGTFQITTNLQTGVATFKLLSRTRSDAFSVNITLYTFVGAPDTPVASSRTNTAYTYTLNVAGTGAPLDLPARVLPDGRVGNAYSETLTATGGTPPYQFSVTGPLPAGLGLSMGGVISGQPTTVESRTFTVTVQDASNATSVRLFSIAVTESAPVAQDSTATVAANTSGVAVALSLSGGAPTGITILQGAQNGMLSVAGVTVSYTPNAGYSGSDFFTYRANNSAGQSEARVDLTVTRPLLAVAPSSGSLPGAAVGSPYSLTLAAAGGTAPYTYAAVGTLPSWLQLTSGGQLTGTPSAPATDTFTLRATDRYGATGEATYSLTTAGQPPIASNVNLSVDANVSSVIPPNLTGGAAATLYIVNQPAHGTVAVDGLQFRYTPTAGYSGPDGFIYAAGNASGRSLDAVVTLLVRTPSLTFTPGAGDLARGTVGQAYAGATIQASGGGAPYRYTLGTGSLPPGLGLDRDTGVISGTPTAANSAPFTVVATDRYGATDSVSYRIVVGTPAPTAGDVTATVPANSPGTAITLQLGGGSATAILIVTPPSHGNAVVSGLSVQYTPQAGYSGADAFTFIARNASGDSPLATVRLTIAPPSLAFTPGPGALPGATADSPYAQTLTVSGGTAPYRYAVTGALPPGLSLTGNTLSGTPTEAGDWRFTVTATDALGASGNAVYTLSTGGAAPIASDHAVQLLAGTRVTIDLAALASGGPFTAAAIVSAPPADAGAAQITAPWKLAYTAAPNASGPVVLRYTISNAWKTSAPATLTFNVLARPDPSKDPEVIGLVTAQVRTAERFATTQIGNFGSRLENLHDEAARHAQPLGLRFAQAGNITRAGRPATNGFDAVFPTAATFGALPAAPLAAADGRADRAAPRGPLALWTGGYVNFGSDRASSTRIEHTLVGVSIGADYRVSPNLVAGMGIGYGREISDIGANGTRSTGTAMSAALYGSYHPGPYFVDGLLGVSRLDFDSRRYVTGTGEQARGSRDGSQLFGSLSVGYEYRQDAVLISPYGRLQGAWTRLNGYTESGASAYSLQFGRQRASLFSSVLGLRGEYASALRWGTLSTRGRLEFSHDLSGDSTARMGYADLGGQPYQLDVTGLSRNALSLELGLQGTLHSGQTLGVAYRTGIGFSDRQRDNSVMLRFSHRY